MQFFSFYIRIFAFIIFLGAGLATFLSAAGFYYKEPGFTLAETLAYAFLAFLAFLAIALIFLKKEKNNAKVL